MSAFIVTHDEMKRCDQNTIQRFGMPETVLIERAALGALDILLTGTFDLRSVCVVCGSGNNGADGFALARLLHQKNIGVHTYFVGDMDHSTDSCRAECAIAQNYGVPTCDLSALQTCTTIVDALFGIGLSREVQGTYAEVIQAINASDASVLSLDIPSGISADSGQVMGVAVKANTTITFGFKKLGLVLFPGADYAGTVCLTDAGITEDGFEKSYPSVSALTPEDISEKLPTREAHTNKGTFGKVLVIAGSVNMSGAAYFSSKSAYRTGAGLVKVFTPSQNRSVLQTALPEAILSTYESGHMAFQALSEALEWSNVVVLGPGLGMDADARFIVKNVLENYSKPLILDADGLNLLSTNPEWHQDLLRNPNLILTPHLGEMARLLQVGIPEISGNLIRTALTFAKQHEVTCVLKDARTVVATSDGKVTVNLSGNSGMSTGGSGDVLTGIIAGLIAQGLTPGDAAPLGVYIHGLAGDLAAQTVGKRAMIASDIIDAIGSIIG